MRKSRKLNNWALKAVERIARNEMEKDAISSSPACSGIYHQPKRPKKSKEVQ